MCEIAENTKKKMKQILRARKKKNEKKNQKLSGNKFLVFKLD